MGGSHQPNKQIAHRAPDYIGGTSQDFFLSQVQNAVLPGLQETVVKTNALVSDCVQSISADADS